MAAKAGRAALSRRGPEGGASSGLRSMCAGRRISAANGRLSIWHEPSRLAAWNSLTSSVCCDVDGVVEFNDAPGRKFSEILGIIREARELAMVDAYVAAIELFVGGSDWRDVCGGWPDNPARSFLDNEPLGLLQAMSATAEPEPEPPMKC